MVLLISVFTVRIAAAQESQEQEAARLQEEAQRLQDSGLYLDGINMAKRALALRETALGNEHPDVAASLQTLGTLYYGAGRYDLSESADQRALTICEKVLGPDHPDTGKALTNLGRLYVHTGAHSKAAPLLQRALAISEKSLGEEHINTSKALVALANLYVQTAAYERAEPMYKRALTIREHLFGAEHVSTASVLNRLANMYQLMGAYARAKPLYQRALAAYEKAGGSEHPEASYPMGNLAALYASIGEYVEAETLNKRALAIQEKKLGPEHPDTARYLMNLAVLYMDTGAYSQAEPLLRRTISVQEKIPALAPEDMANSLTSLGTLYAWMDRPTQAEPLYRQAIAMFEKSLGAKHPSTAVAVANLGDLYREMGAYDRAEPLVKRSIFIREATLGQEHQLTGAAIYQLADLYYDTGAYDKAQPLYRRTLAIYEKALGPDHPRTAGAFRSLAVLHWARGESQLALSLLQRAQRIQANNAERFLLSGSEARKQEYLLTLTDHTFLDLSFAMSTPGTAATQLGLTSVLQHKGRVLDAVSDNLARLRRSVAPVDQALLEQLADVAGQLSALTYGQGANLSLEQYRERLAQLSARQEQLQADLASRSRAFSREVTPVTVTNVKAAIPVNAALVEWFRYTPFDPKKSRTARRGSPRYVAQGVDALVRRWRVALADPASSDVKQHAAALSARLLAPLRIHLRGVQHILFSPDGELNLVPMAALLDESGAYLAERFDVSYLTSGRDLLRLASESTPLANAVVVADPDYGKRGAVSRAEPTLQPQRSLDLDRSGLVFRPLAGTALEAQDLKALLKLDEASVLLRRDASETKLKRLKAPRILHIASHGFFLSDQQLTAEVTKRRGSDSAPLAPSENPLLRSGIALAAANERGSGDDDGILTALEATQLDLSGTELVVLSACDSGVGEVQNGEGVYGLRRALALAGAQTQITSLWKVSDDATRSLMVDYYRRLLQGEGRSEALRQVQRAMLSSSTFSHPYYWASFIPIGSWNSLPPGKQGSIN